MGFSQKNLTWKEFKEKRWLLLSLVLLIPLAGLAGAGSYATFGAHPGYPGMIEDSLALGPLLYFFLGSFILGTQLFTRAERDPQSAFLYSLPVSRAKILSAKFKSLFIQWLLFAALSLPWILYLCAKTTFSDSMNIAIALATATLALPAMTLAAVVSLYLRSTLTGLLVSITLALPAGFLLAVASHLAKDWYYAFYPARVIGLLLVDVALTTAALMGWLYFLYCRKKLDELGAVQRTLLGLLFGVVLIELVFTFFLCDYRDLLYLLFGI